MKKKTADHETFAKLLQSVMKHIPTIPAEKKTLRRVKKLYFTLTAPVSVIRETKKIKDKTKYRLDGKILPKGRFALAVIKKWASGKTLAQIKTEFPDALTGKVTSLGLIRESKNVKHLNRFFMDTPIKTADGKKIVVSSQFGISNIKPIYQKAMQFGFDAEVVTYKGK